LNCSKLTCVAGLEEARDMLYASTRSTSIGWSGRLWERDIAKLSAGIVPVDTQKVLRLA
jgi:hypothetical protein